MNAEDREANLLTDIEEDVRTAMRQELEPFVAFLGHVYDYCAEVSDLLIGGGSMNGTVRCLVIARLQADLRVCEWAASAGYGLQAMTIASAVHETAWTLLYVGSSEDRAREWVEHDKDRQSYPGCGHKNVLETIGPQVGLAPEAIAREQVIYSNLCMAKHSNPMMHREYGHVERGEVIEIQRLPYYSTVAVRQCRFAMLHASRAVLTCVWRIARDLEHLSTKDQKALYARSADLVAMGSNANVIYNASEP